MEVGVDEEPPIIRRPCPRKAESQDDLVGWDLIKKWSRRQVERAVKSLISRLYCANAAVPSPAEITRFVRLALRSPSAHVLYPHLVCCSFINVDWYYLTIWSILLALSGISQLSED
jgi:hypothetical protein